MAIRTDIQVDENGGIVIDPVTGDFVIIESDNQHIDLNMQSHKGMWKQHPTLGPGLSNYLNTSGQINAARIDAINSLKLDDYTNISFIVEADNNIFVNAKFKGNDN
jgi:hypothetical protein